MKMERRKIIGIVTALAVIVFALTIGISVYSAAPENKLSRQINLGHKYLENGEYEEAAIAFENAIAIDEKCMEAYVGGIEAYLQMNDADEVSAFYDRALSVVRSLDGELLEQNIDFIVEIYLAADRVYSDDLEQKASLLEEGWSFTEDIRIKEKLIVEYLAIAEEKIETEDYEGGLEVFDRLLELAGDDERVLEALEKCLNAYLEHLLEKERYDEIRRIAEKYREAATGIDFDGILKQIEEKEALEKEIALKREAEEKEEQEIQEEEAQDAEEEAESEDSEVTETENTAQSGNWVDDLYQKIIAEDADAVFAIMEQPDFIEKCEEFPHSEVVWSIDYSLLTSDGKIFWVLKSINYDDLYVTCSPDLNAADCEVGGAVEGCGDYTYSIEDGERNFYDGFFGVFHMP
ncbi:hypothetical protein D5282_22220 [bacterium 1xD8-48]|nr:hypothetical protein [bacterium 1xD8-48]